ncbi:MAG: hypothetical protein K2V38_19375 [Gemmataceae bacterium]|nr:hypothetical protein [Gemmataceae bacterium]
MARTSFPPRRWRAWADDARQDVALHSLAKPQTGVAGDPDAYERGAVRRRLCSLLRRERRHAHAPLDAVPAAAADRAAQDERANGVHAVLGAMREGGSKASADLLEWRFLDRLPVARIAERLGKSPAAVSAQLQRAKKKFRAAWLAAGLEAGGGIVAVERIGRSRFFRVRLARRERLDGVAITSQEVRQWCANWSARSAVSCCSSALWARIRSTGIRANPTQTRVVRLRCSKVRAPTPSIRRTRSAY